MPALLLLLLIPHIATPLLANVGIEAASATSTDSVRHLRVAAGWSFAVWLVCRRLSLFMGIACRHQPRQWRVRSLLLSCCDLVQLPERRWPIAACTATSWLSIRVATTLPLKPPLTLDLPYLVSP